MSGWRLTVAQTAGTSLDEWLTLHEIDAATCRHLVGSAGSTTGPKPPDAPLNLSDPWGFVIGCLRHALPEAGPVLDRAAQEVRIDLAPDKVMFPRAFTLHDDGRGLPFISCPMKGRVSDVLTLAHELGHACQALLAPQRVISPILRETAAFLAEELVISAVEDREMAGDLQSLHKDKTTRLRTRHVPALLRALDDPRHAYDYGWNYPIARDLAGRAANLGPSDFRYGILRGSFGVRDLMSRLSL
jgi:hypothetical protein